MFLQGRRCRRKTEAVARPRAFASCAGEEASGKSAAATSRAAQTATGRLLDLCSAMAD
jgi:hypothetical protein